MLVQVVRGAVPIATVATLGRLSGMGLTERKGNRDEATSLGRELVRRHFDGDAA